MKKRWIIAGISIALVASLQAATCDGMGFDLATQDTGVSAEEVIKHLATECSYSIFLKDEEARARLKIDMPALNIRQAPLEQIFDLVLKENGLHYEFDGKALRISYLVTKTFKIDYVGTDRSGISTTNISINRDEGGQETSTSSTNNRSSNQETTSSSSGGSKSGIDIRAEDGFRFWDGIQAEIEAILNRPGDFYNYFVVNGSTQSSQGVVASSQNTLPQPTGIDASPAISNLLGQIPQSATGVVSATGGGTYTYPSAALAVIASTSQAPQTTAQLARPTQSQAGFVTVNRGAGLVTVTGTSEQISRVSKYIDELHERLQGQVMIDVSILTVRHNRGSTTGIDWNQLYNLQNIALMPKGGSNSSGDSGSSSSGSSSTASLAPGSIQMANESGMLLMGYGSDMSKAGYALNIFSQGVTLTRVVEFLKTYGDVSSVSNPKVLTLNNQPAMISVGDTIRYRQSTVFQTNSSSNTNTNSSTSYPSVFAGVLLDITPSVQNGEIMLKINPSITSVKSIDVESAATALDSPPNLSINQLSSIVKVKDGEKIILGGLIRKANNKKENKVPLLGDVPLLGYFFSYEADMETTDEMVIVITPHIVKGDKGPSLQDLGYTIMGRNPLE
ncbi:MAG: pilus (MSHA type) biogenesis protein MshL [Wolinella sp.]